MKKTKEIVLPLGIGQRPKRRPARVADMVLEEMALLLLSAIKDPRLANVTVTRVSMTPDLKQAVIYYSVLGGAKQIKDAEIGWSRARGFVRNRLAAKLQLRYAPEPVFKRDLDMEKHAEIERLLAEIKEEDNEPSP